MNSAADDPSGLVISEQMRAQADGLAQAIRNSHDGTNLVKTAEAALNEVHSLLRQMRTLAVHAANSGVNSDEAVAADQAQLDKAVEVHHPHLRHNALQRQATAGRTYSSMTFQIGANSTDTVSVSITSMSATALSITGLTLSTDAATAISTIDDAIATVSTARSELGSIQKNTLETTINSLSVAEENIRASESTIRDADIAAEMVTFTRNNIMLQAGTAMLAQANAAPQAILQLLR